MVNSFGIKQQYLQSIMNASILKGIISNLANLRAFFCSEADFQHSIALALASPTRKVYLEYPIIGVGHVDIIVEENGLYYPIELKYKTKVDHCQGILGNIDLMAHGAHNINRYLFWKDVSRIEVLKQLFPERIVEGYVIMLTNDPLYWNRPMKKPKPSKKTVNDWLFRIHSGKRVKVVQWLNTNQAPSYKAGHNTYSSFSLRKMYTVPQWSFYSKGYNNSQNATRQFQFLLIAV